MNGPNPEATGTRTTTSTATFGHPFRLGSDPRELAAGTYRVETDERVFTQGDHSWSLRVGAVVEVAQDGRTSFRHVAPADVDRALAADAVTAALLGPHQDRLGGRTGP